MPLRRERLAMELLAGRLGKMQRVQSGRIEADVHRVVDTPRG